MRVAEKTNLANSNGATSLENMHITRGTKTQNFPDSNFFRAKNFRTKRAKPFLATNLKRVFASQDIAKECVFNVLELLYDTIQYNTLQYNVIQRTGLFWSP